MLSIFVIKIIRLRNNRVLSDRLQGMISRKKDVPIDNRELINRFSIIYGRTNAVLQIACIKKISCSVAVQRIFEE